jgi:5-methylcytosine-specific restriction endonuclease McrA
MKSAEFSHFRQGRIFKPLEFHLSRRRAIIPLSCGGADEPKNTLASCNKCNSAKGSMELDEFLKSDFLKNRKLKYKKCHSNSFCGLVERKTGLTPRKIISQKRK